MNVNEVVLGKEGVNSLSRNRTDAEYRAEGVGTGAQMRYGTKVFKRMLFLLERIIGGRGALYDDRVCLDLKGLLRLGGELQRTHNIEGRAAILPGYLLIIIELRLLEDDLKAFKAASVIELDKTEGIGCTNRTAPACNGHGLARKAFGAVVELFDRGTFHSVESFHSILIKNIIYYAIITDIINHYNIYFRKLQ